MLLSLPNFWHRVDLTLVVSRVTQTEVLDLEAPLSVAVLEDLKPLVLDAPGRAHKKKAKV